MRTPVIVQMEDVECGAAALGIVLAYYGKHASLEELRVACGVSRDGSKATNILRAARQYSLVARGMQLEPHHLVAGVAPAPAILFWNFDHFVVWEGFRRRFGRSVALINDPATGRRSLDDTEFAESFTGVALTMWPGPGFRSGGRRPRLLAGLLSRLRGATDALMVALVASVLLVLLGAAIPIFTSIFIDYVFPGRRSSMLVPFCVAMAATAVLTGVLTAIQQGYLLRAQVATDVGSAARFVRHLLRLPAHFFTVRQPAEIVRRLQSTNAVSAALVMGLAPAAVNVVVVVGYAALLWTYDWQLTIVGVSVAVLNVVLLRLVLKARESGVHRLRGDLGQLYMTSYNGVQAIESLKASGGEDGFLRQWMDHHARVVNGEQRLGVPAGALSAVAPMIATFSSALILLVGGLHTVEGKISIGLLAAFQLLVLGFAEPVSYLASTADTVQDLAADVARLRDVEDYPADQNLIQPEPHDRDRLPSHLTLANVTFGYNRLDPPTLHDVSLSVRPGQMVALVGASGSGKSTVSKLIAGLHEPWEGSICFDGSPRLDIPRTVLAHSVAFVDQDIVLFRGTVRDNVTLWDPSISDEAVIAALRNAALYEIVGRRAGGIHAQVDEDGSNFSGGQRQRLEIARALVRNPRILVLDEATSALDTETELRVVANLRRLGCACLVIAHRLSTVRDCDEIIVFDGGRVVERGKHEELSATGGAYARLVKGD